MKKIIISVLLVVTILVTNFALRYIHTEKISDNLEFVQSKLSEKGLKFDYENISYKGMFFWHINGEISNPVFTQEKHGVKDKSSLEYVKFTSYLFQKELVITFANQVITSIKDIHGESKYISNFLEDPKVKIIYKDYFNKVNKTAYINYSLTEIFANYLKYFEYNSKGHIASKIDDTGNQDKIYSIEETNVKVNNISSFEVLGINFDLDVKNNQYFKNNLAESFYNYLAEAGESSIKLNTDILFNFKDDEKIELTEGVILEKVQPTYKFNTKEFKYNTSIFSLDLIGNSVLNKTTILPFFDLNLKVNNFEKLVEFYSDFYNNFIMSSGFSRLFSLKEIKEKQKNAILQTGAKISLGQNSKEGYKFKIINLKEKKLEINSFSIDQVLEIYDSFLSEQDGNEKNTNLEQ